MVIVQKTCQHHGETDYASYPGTTQRPRCIQCKKDYAKTTRAKKLMKARNSKPEYRESRRQSNSRYQDKLRDNRRALINLKGGACECCGLVDTCEQVYDFHHREPELKKFKLTVIRSITKKVIAELFKCDLLCANCHRRTHASEI